MAFPFGIDLVKPTLQAVHRYPLLICLQRETAPELRHGRMAGENRPAVSGQKRTLNAWIKLRREAA